MVDAAVVGSGPNGLSAAIVLARAGLRVRVHEAEPTIGGGARSAALTLPGFIHDVCSAFHPLGASSPFFKLLPLKEHGLEWIHPDYPLAHPLEDGTAAVLQRSVDETARALGGEIVTDDRIDVFAQLGKARAYLFDTTPRALEHIAADKLNTTYRRVLRAYTYGPGVFKVDYALAGPVPWRAAECRRAGTVHVGGTFEEIAAGEKAVSRGELPERPFVLVGQQSLFDPTRAPLGMHTLWTYCHVPSGSTVDMTARIEAQIERFAPGFRDLILKRSVMNARDVESHNANYVGGDISTGAHGGLQFMARPSWSIDPYATPTREVYLCSAATPPAAGVHGLCGYNAARSALRRSFDTP